MSISIGSTNPYASLAGVSASDTSADSLEKTLKSSSSSDDDKLMESCKSFESYLMEQVFKSMESTVDKSEDEQNDDYMNQFGDMLYEKVAKDATDTQSIGLAQMLYDSMKKN